MKSLADDTKEINMQITCVLVLLLSYLRFNVHPNVKEFEISVGMIYCSCNVRTSIQIKNKRLY